MHTETTKKRDLHKELTEKLPDKLCIVTGKKPFL